MAETVKVRALKPFFSGKRFRPGLVDVPAEKVTRLAELGFIEAPAGGEGAAQVESDGRLEAAVSRISAATGVTRAEGEPSVDYLERLAEEAEARKSKAQSDELPNDFPYRADLIEGGFVTLSKVRAASDEELVGAPHIGKARVKEIREALKG